MVRFHRQLLTATTPTTCLFFCGSSDSSADFPAPAVSLRGARDRNYYFSWHWVIGYIQCKCVFYFLLCNAILCDTWHSFDYLLDLHVLFDGSWFYDYMSVHPDSAIWLQGINLDDKSETSISIYFIKKRLWTHDMRLFFQEKQHHQLFHQMPVTRCVYPQVTRALMSLVSWEKRKRWHWCRASVCRWMDGSTKHQSQTWETNVCFHSPARNHPP